MPWQLVYTSAPRGLTPGQSGYCTVARARELREGLVTRLEKLSYFAHEPGRSPIICAHRILLVRGVAFHVLTRILDAGHDFTRRRSFLAHHLVFDPAEIANAAAPATLFKEWSGWIDRWEGEPKWLEATAPLPAKAAGSNQFPNAWVEASDSFLETLIERGAGWDTTFTNHFQGGDHPEDFAIKGIAPAAAARLGVELVRWTDLQPLEKAAPARWQEAPVEAAAPPTPPQPQGKHFPWPAFAAVLVLILAATGLYFRYRPEVGRVSPSAPPPALPQTVLNENLFPANPTTFLVVLTNNEGATGPIPAFHALLKQLQSSEVFTKDLRASVQTNLDLPPVAAKVEAKLEQHLLRFSLTNGFAADLFVAPGHTTTARVRSSSAENFAIQLDDAFRIVAIKKPILLSRAFLKLEKNAIGLEPMVEARLRTMVLPKNAQLALRPSNDPFAALEKDFGLGAATAIDLDSVRAHVEETMAAKAKRVEDLKREQDDLNAQREKAITNFKGQERLDALNLAVPKAVAELDSMRARAAAVPREFTKTERFSVLLCLSNVNTEIIRFEEGAAR